MESEIQIFIRSIKLARKWKGETGREFDRKTIHDFFVQSIEWRSTTNKISPESYFYFAFLYEKRGASFSTICSAEFVDFGEGICLERKEKGSKETNKQNCERMSAGQSLQKILYDTTRSSFPSGLFLLASSFPFKKKKNDRFYNFGNWRVKITYFPLSGRKS